MERESFTSLPVAKLHNDGFVSVKVDKEERSDVDRVYMTYVQVRCSGLTCACPRTHPKCSIGGHLSSILAEPASAGRSCLRSRATHAADAFTPPASRLHAESSPAGC